MLKAPFIALVLLLVLSLGTSVYLLMDQKKVKAVLGNSQNDADKKAKAYKKLAEEIKTVEGERNDAKKELTSAKRTSDVNKSKYDALIYKKSSNDKKYEKLRSDLAEAAKNKATLQEAIVTLAASKKDIDDKFKNALVLSADANATIEEQRKMFEAKDKEIFDLTDRIKKLEKHGLTPANNPERNNNPSLSLKEPGISRPKRKPPGKLTKPPAGPGPR